jgi:protease-4
MSFLKSFFASCLGALVAMILLVILGIGVLVSIQSAGTEEVIADNSVLHLKLEAPISELEVDDPVADVFPGAGENSYGLLQIKQAIRNAKDDPKIKGIYLNTSMLMSGIATIQEIREALIDFKTSGKWVVSYADFYTEGGYYLASAADKVYLGREGDMEFNGLATEVMFFKKMFDKLEIKPEIFRVGQFKSAVEPFLRDNLSEENKLQLNSMLNSIYGAMLADISVSRNIPAEKLRAMADQMTVRSGKLAKENGLIDSLVYEDEMIDILRGRLGLADKKKVSLVKYGKYKKTFKADLSSSNEIAVIVADGDIMPGKADQGTVGAATFVEQIRRARTNDKVKAIVLRINSPGGAFQAADNMWREITLATKEKPVIASMGDYAASGGYYLAMGCDTIVARPTTITGSIGIFSVLFDMSDFLGNKIGITNAEVKTGEIGNLTSFTRPLSEVEKNIWQNQTNTIYETFTGKAAEGRHMKVEDLKEIASGRVWTGEQAKGNGLADVLGGFDDAVRIAAGRANLGNDYKLLYYPRPRPFLEKLFGNYEDNAKADAMRTELGALYPYYQQWMKVKNYQGVQARMPLEFQIR